MSADPLFFSIPERAPYAPFECSGPLRNALSDEPRFGCAYFPTPGVAERVWWWLLRYMRGESIDEIAARDKVNRSLVIRWLRRLEVWGKRKPKPPIRTDIPKVAQTAYRRQKGGAKSRCIGWSFTLDTWWAVWLDSGLWDERGNWSGGYVMGRFGDEGPYAPGNVSIIPFEQNIRDGIKNAIVRKRAADPVPASA